MCINFKDSRIKWITQKCRTMVKNAGDLTYYCDVSLTQWAFQSELNKAGPNDLAVFILAPVNGPWKLYTVNNWPKSRCSEFDIKIELLLNISLVWYTCTFFFLAKCYNARSAVICRRCTVKYACDNKVYEDYVIFRAQNISRLKLH